MATRCLGSNHSFLLKCTLALMLAWLSDLLLGSGAGTVVGVCALAWIGAVVVARPAGDRRALPALGAAILFGAMLVEDPSLLAALLFWASLSLAVLLPRHRFDDAARWAARLLRHAALGLSTPFVDIARVGRARARVHARVGVTRVLATLALPLIGGGVFVTLFAGANPLIARALGSIALPDPTGLFRHLGWWALALLLVWPSLRPHPLATRGAPEVAGRPPLFADLPPATSTLALVTFNLLFAVENALDLTFLWSGAALPAGVTLAEYAHRGAYSLIVTALLAGLFVLVALRPGSAGARSPLVRRLLVVWIAQNLLLVASSALRLVDYIASFSLTVLRVSALAWMGLVAVGLVLVAWRMLAGKSAAWLLNRNAAAAALVLAAASAVDLGAVAARWNVDHARRAEQLDLCYLHQLGVSALLPLIDLERRAGGPVLRDRARYLRGEALAEVTRRQADWHSWRWRNARRLAAARALLGPNPPRATAGNRRCDGAMVSAGAVDEGESS